MSQCIANDIGAMTESSEFMPSREAIGVIKQRLKIGACGFRLSFLHLQYVTELQIGIGITVVEQ